MRGDRSACSNIAADRTIPTLTARLPGAPCGRIMVARMGPMVK
jgi:hypothetical protein